MRNAMNFSARGKWLRRIGGVAVAALLAGVGVSCGSDPTAPDGELYVRFRADGELVNYTHQNLATAFFGQAGPIRSLSISGSTTGTQNFIQASVFRESDITTGTYLGTELVGTEHVGTVIDYSGGGVTYRSDSDASVILTITEITSTTVRGTFQGVVSANGVPAVAITQGEFFVSRTN